MKEMLMANTITRTAGCWIQYQLKLNGLTYGAVAHHANRSIDIVSKFLTGRKDSKPVRAALCKVLGYQDFSTLMAACPDTAGEGGKGGAA
jgi:hypothetical protein